MASFLNTTAVVTTTTHLPPSVTKPTVLSILTNDKAMLTINPLLRSYTLLPPSGSVAFYKTVPSDLKPASSAIESTPVYSVVEAQASDSTGEEGGTWRGGWSKRFIPDEIVYETSMQATNDGMVAITHAPMGVHSVTTWTIREEGEGGLVVEIEGKVTSNRMLMGFIKTTLQGSYDKLAKDFLKIVEEEVKESGEKTGAEDAPVAVPGEQQVEIQAVA